MFCKFPKTFWEAVERPSHQQKITSKITFSAHFLHNFQDSHGNPSLSIVLCSLEDDLQQEPRCQRVACSGNKESDPQVPWCSNKHLHWHVYEIYGCKNRNDWAIFGRNLENMSNHRAPRPQETTGDQPFFDPSGVQTSATEMGRQKWATLRLVVPKFVSDPGLWLDLLLTICVYFRRSSIHSWDYELTL